MGVFTVACSFQEKARSPTGLLTVQIGKMECGQFVGKIKPDKDVERMARDSTRMKGLLRCHCGPILQEHIHDERPSPAVQVPLNVPTCACTVAKSSALQLLLQPTAKESSSLTTT